MKIIADAVCFRKNIVLWMLVFLPLAAYSQYLEPKDVDILIDNWDIINSAMQNEGKTEEEKPVWEAFNERGSKVVGCFEEMRYTDDEYSEDPSGFENFRQSYDEFMNGKTPPSLQRTFETVGWGKRGLQKMFTLLFGMMFIVLDRELSEYGDETNTGYSRALEVIDKSDRGIIEDNMEKIMQLVSG